VELNALKQALTEIIQAERGLAGMEVLVGFPAGSHLPLSGPAILLAIDGLELFPASLNGFEQEGAGAEVTVRFDFFSPRQGGHTLHLLYEALCAALAGSGQNLGLTRIRRDALVWDEIPGCYRLTAGATLKGRATIGRGRAPEPNITDFRLTTVDS